jgi:hypothetical protein
MKFNSIQRNYSKLGKLSLLGLAILLFLFISTKAFNKAPNSNKKQYADTTIVKSGPREVLTSQKLFITELSNIKEDKNGEKANIKAELRDAFKIIRYDIDSPRTELDWLLSSEYGDPKAGLYNEGTAEYQKLDTLITNIKKKLAKKK